MASGVPPAKAASQPARVRAVGFLVYDGVQLLSVAGPSEIFTAVNRLFAERDLTPTAPAYYLQVFSPGGRGVVAASGLAMDAAPLPAPDAPPLDTLFVPGGSGIRAVMADPTTLEWLRLHAPRARRLVSLGGGGFILARAGLLGRRRCVTHWRFEADLVREYPDVRLVSGQLFVRDGALFSAAGGSAGIDLTLRLVHDDFGGPIAMNVARMMVLSRVRPGQQAQLSAEFQTQFVAKPRVAQAAAWIVEHIDTRPTVAGLAGRFAMSERNFSRSFSREMGLSPQKFIEQTRLETARRLLTASPATLEAVARKAGFSGAEHMAQVFRRHLGATPQAYRRAVQARGGREPDVA